MTLGEYYEKLGDCNKAISYYQTSLNYSVASNDEEEIIKKKIKTCEKLINENGN